MNDVVTAKDMSVTIKSDASYLLIKAGVATAQEVQAAKKVEDSATNPSAQILPAAHNSITKISEADAVANWYYKTSDDPALYGGTGHESAPVALSTLTGYVLENTFTLTVAAGANNMEDIKVGACTITTEGDKAVKVLVATATGAQEFSGEGGNGTEVLQSSLSSSTIMTVKVYIYWDGEDADVYTNGIADLKNTSVTITFVGTTVVA